MLGKFLDDMTSALTYSVSMIGRLFIDSLSCLTHIPQLNECEQIQEDQEWVAAQIVNEKRTTNKPIWRNHNLLISNSPWIYKEELYVILCTHNATWLMTHKSQLKKKQTNKHSEQPKWRQMKQTHTHKITYSQNAPHNKYTRQKHSNRIKRRSYSSTKKKYTLRS